MNKVQVNPDLEEVKLFKKFCEIIVIRGMGGKFMNFPD